MISLSSTRQEIQPEKEEAKVKRAKGNGKKQNKTR